jgi:signal transduction histidine kinase
MPEHHDVHYVLAQPRRQNLAVHVRARRIQLILLAVLLYLPAVFISASALVSGSHWWGLDAQPLDNDTGAWQVTWSDRGLSADANIQAGDKILQVDGHTPHSEQEINQANELQILSPRATTAWVASWQAPTRIDTLFSLSWLLLGLVSLLLGLLVFLHATDRSLAIRFFLLWTALAIASTFVPALSFGNLLAVHLVSILYVGVASGLMESFLWRLLFTTPSGNQQQRTAPHPRFSWLPEIPVLTGLLYAILYLVAVTQKQPAMLEGVSALASVQTILALGLALFLVLHVAVFRRAGVARERARTLLGGLILGLTPPLALTVIPQLITGLWLVPGTASTVSIVVLPLAFAYAIVRRDLLRLDSLIRNTILVLLTVIGMAIAAVLVTIGLEQLPTPAAMWVGIIAGALLAPFVLAGARWVTESWLFPQVRLYRRLIAQGESIERTGLDPQRVAGQLVGEVHLALPVRQVAVFVPDKQTGRLVEISVPQAYTRLGDYPLAVPEPKGTVSLAVPAQTGVQEHRALFIDEALSEKLFRDNGPFLVEAVRTSETSKPNRAEPDQEDWHLLVPMRVRGRLIGVLTLSQREDDQAYSDTDLRLLRFLAGRRSLALDYAILYADLHTAYERRQELDRLKDQFIVTAHHELRTPLTGVQGYLELLSDLGPEGRALRPQEADLFIERACRATEELNEQLNSLLAAAESNLGQEALQQRPAELSQIAQRAIQSLDALAQRGRYRIRNSIPPDLIALGDEEALYRIFMNLLSNALKYSPEGRPVLFDGRTRRIAMPSAGNNRQTENNKYPVRFLWVAEVVVRDWGVGIAKADQHKIFERFTRLERDLNSPVRGSGLGLAICRDLIEAMDGVIWVESEGVAGLGSAFYIRLPLAESSVANTSSSAWEDPSVVP